MLWYFSFANTDPGQRRFLGAAIVEGHDFHAALARAGFLGINPGGEAVALPINPEAAAVLPAEFRDRLMTIEELKQLGPVGNIDQYQRENNGTIPPGMVRVCKRCNAGRACLNHRN